ncbi:MAG: AAA family ATPase [Chloroflexi bacterium]|nr:AAA family ATPase [Chloroflexota bacterium]
MSNGLARLEVHNFRSLAHVDISLGPVNVLFGPNGSGKSTFLDTIWFVRDCSRRGVDEASSERSHGIGALWDGADEGANIAITLETDLAEYTVRFGYSSGRIEPFVGETLYSKERDQLVMDRKIGSDNASFWHTKMEERMQVSLREPEKLALTRYLDLEEWSPSAAYNLEKSLKFTNLYSWREADFYRLRNIGSDVRPHLHLYDRAENLWSVLQNTLGRRAQSDQYDTIVGFMRQGFPLFNDLLIETTGANRVYGSFIERGRRQPIQASGVSDGHLQLLSLLTALFSTGRDREAIVMFDEPEMSLHPHALAVFAKAVKLVAEEWNRQVFIATHSPVLISQFEPESILAFELDQAGKTVITRLSEIDAIQDLLRQYAAGSLYMAEVIAAQSSLLPEAGE